MRERFHRCLATTVTFLQGSIIFAVLCLILVAATDAHAAIYYVDCDTGSDINDGLSQTSAWRSTDKVAAFNFQDGDHVRFKKGCVWENALIKVSRSLTIEAYGDAPALPHLVGAVRIPTWVRLPGSEIVSATAAIAPGSHGPKEILIVYDERHRRFYDKVSALSSLTAPGQFFHDAAARLLYVRPLAGVDPSREFYVSSRNHIIELQPGSVEGVVVEGLRLSFANEYAVGFWYQSSDARYGSLRVANCEFFGHAVQAIHVGGTNTFRDIDILNNTITAIGNEGVYIRYLKGPDQGREQGLVVTRMLRISGNNIGGNGFGWRSDGRWSNGEGLDIKSGVFAGVIDHNTLFDLRGMFAIAVLSSNVIVEHNDIRNVSMPGATPEDGIAGIILDAYENRGTTVVRNNVIQMSNAHGIALRGVFDLRPRSEIYDNDITVAEPYAPFAFTSQNVANTVIRNNRTRGGGAALAVLKPCCPPVGVEVWGNVFQDILVPVLTAKDLSRGVQMTTNLFCVRGSVDLARRMSPSGNTIVSAGECGRPVANPQNLRVQ